jgi:[ribosomal protein S5]-alanine N-acetyltransferase
MLGAQLLPGWPPGEYDRAAMHYFRERLLAEGDAAGGWYGWYAIARGGPGAPRELVGAAGYLGPPAPDGSIEIGYSVVAGVRGRGYATEMAQAMVTRAFAHPGVRRVLAETHADNAPSRAVLVRLGFRHVGPGRDAGHGRWQLDRP